MYHTLYHRLATIPDHVEVWPGAYAGSVCGRGLSGKPASTLGFERAANPALGRTSPEDFAAFVLEGLPPKPADFALIRDINCGNVDPGQYGHLVIPAPELTVAIPPAADVADCCTVAPEVGDLA
jgi:hypothetical protein